MNKILKLLDKNFNEGVSIFQMFLMGIMIFGAIVGNNFLILFSMFNILFAYFESNTPRFSFNKCIKEVKDAQ